MPFPFSSTLRLICVDVLGHFTGFTYVGSKSVRSMLAPDLSVCLQKCIILRIRQPTTVVFPYFSLAIKINNFIPQWVTVKFLCNRDPSFTPTFVNARAQLNSPTASFVTWLIISPDQGHFETTSVVG